MGRSFFYGKRWKDTLIYLIFSACLVNKYYKNNFVLSKRLSYSEFIVNLQ